MLQQFKPGDTREKNGWVYERQENGQWVPKQPVGGAAAPSAVQIKPADPKLGLEVQKLEQDIEQGAIKSAIAPLEARATAADAALKEAELARGGMTVKERNDLLARRTVLPEFMRAVDEIERQFQQNFAGDKGGILGMGGETNAAGRFLPDMMRPENEQFRAASDSLIGAIAQIQGTTGGEMNSLAEMRARFGPLIPSPGDSDATIAQKIAGLRSMVAAQERALAVQLGEEAAPSPDTAPIGKTAGGADATVQRVGAPGSRDAMEVTEQKYRTEDDPALAGVNARLNKMMQEGATRADFVQFLRKTGIPPGEVMQSIDQALEFRRKNPGYRGDYSVNVDDRMVPMSGTRRFIADIANSPGGAYAMSAGNVVTGNRLDNVVELLGGNGELANIGMEQVRANHPGSSFVGDLTGGAMLYGAGRGVLGMAGKAGAPAAGTFAPSALAGDAALGGYIASGSNGTDLFSTGAAVKGALAGGAGGVVGRGVLNSAGRALSPTGGALAPAYAEGVQPTIGQRVGGVVNRAEQAFASIPGVGGIQRASRARALKQWQTGAVNRALREIDDALPKGTDAGVPAQRYMQKAFNRAYDRARAGMRVQMDDELAGDISTMRRSLDELSDESRSRFERITTGVRNKLEASGGTLSGNGFKSEVSRLENRIRAIRKSQSGDSELADSLEEFVLALDANARRHSPPEAVALMDAADRGYVSAVVIETAGARAGGEIGEFSGKQLEGAIRQNSGKRSRQMLRGDHPMQDYAAAGARMGDTLPDSGTPERLATIATGGMGAAAHFVDPITLTPWLADTIANLPGARSAVNALLAPNRKALDPARRFLEKRARAAGVITTAPAAQLTTQ